MKHQQPLILLNYFDAIRSGDKSALEIAGYLTSEIANNPHRFQQALTWLEQAQAINPIPATEFNTLRSAVAAAMETEETRIRPAIPSPAPSLIPAMPLLGWLSIVLFLGVLATVSFTYWLSLQNAEPKPITQPLSTAATAPPVEQSAPMKPAIKLNQQTSTQKIEPSRFVPGLDADQWLVEIKRRAHLGLLLPPQDTYTASHLLSAMEQRYPDAQQTILARDFLRGVYLQHAEQARHQNQWEQAQRLLDEAFKLLQTKAD